MIQRAALAAWRTMPFTPSKLRWFFIEIIWSLVGVTAVPLSAQDVVLEIDPAQTRIEFTLSARLHTVHGTFKLKHGTIRFDTVTGKASGMLIVDATSGDSGNGARDRKMHKDILESQKYPDISILPTQVQGHLSANADSQAELQGIFQMHGGEHPVNLKADVHVAGDLLTATTHLVIPYIQWGLQNPSTFILRVGDKVDIEIHAVGHVTFPMSR